MMKKSRNTSPPGPMPRGAGSPLRVAQAYSSTLIRPHRMRIAGHQRLNHQNSEWLEIQPTLRARKSKPMQISTSGPKMDRGRLGRTGAGTGFGVTLLIGSPVSHVVVAEPFAAGETRPAHPETHSDNRPHPARPPPEKEHT